MPHKDPIERKKYARARYIKNREKFLRYADESRERYRVAGKVAHWNRERYKRLREFVNYLKSLPCADCGIQYPPYVMDFDHRDGEEKIFSIGRAATLHVTLDAILEEAEKCDIVCSNCHRERTYGKN